MKLKLHIPTPQAKGKKDQSCQPLAAPNDAEAHAGEVSKQRQNIPHEDQSKIWPEGFRGGCSAPAEFVSA